MLPSVSSARVLQTLPRSDAARQRSRGGGAHVADLPVLVELGPLGLEAVIAAGVNEVDLPVGGDRHALPVQPVREGLPAIVKGEALSQQWIMHVAAGDEARPGGAEGCRSRCSRR